MKMQLGLSRGTPSEAQQGHRWKCNTSKVMLYPNFTHFPEPLPATPMTLGGRQPERDWQVTERLERRGWPSFARDRSLLRCQCSRVWMECTSHFWSTQQMFHTMWHGQGHVTSNWGTTLGLLALSWRSCNMTSKGPSSSRVLVAITKGALRLLL